MKPIDIPDEAFYPALDHVQQAANDEPLPINTGSVSNSRTGESRPFLLMGWEFTAAERDAISAGANLICLVMAPEAAFGGALMAIEGVE